MQKTAAVKYAIEGKYDGRQVQQAENDFKDFQNTAKTVGLSLKSAIPFGFLSQIGGEIQQIQKRGVEQSNTFKKLEEGIVSFIGTSIDKIAGNLDTTIEKLSSLQKQLMEVSSGSYDILINTMLTERSNFNQERTKTDTELASLLKDLKQYREKTDPGLVKLINNTPGLLEEMQRDAGSLLSTQETQRVQYEQMTNIIEDYRKQQADDNKKQIERTNALVQLAQDNASKTTLKDDDSNDILKYLMEQQRLNQQLQKNLQSIESLVQQGRTIDELLRQQGFDIIEKYKVIPVDVINGQVVQQDIGEQFRSIMKDSPLFEGGGSYKSQLQQPRDLNQETLDMIGKTLDEINEGSLGYFSNTAIPNASKALEHQTQKLQEYADALTNISQNSEQYKKTIQDSIVSLTNSIKTWKKEQEDAQLQIDLIKNKQQEVSSGYLNEQGRIRLMYSPPPTNTTTTPVINEMDQVKIDTFQMQIDNAQTSIDKATEGLNTLIEYNNAVFGTAADADQQLSDITLTLRQADQAQQALTEANERQTNTINTLSQSLGIASVGVGSLFSTIQNFMDEKYGQATGGIFGTAGGITSGIGQIIGNPIVALVGQGVSLVGDIITGISDLVDSSKAKEDAEREELEQRIGSVDVEDTITGSTYSGDIYITLTVDRSYVGSDPDQVARDLQRRIQSLNSIGGI